MSKYIDQNQILSETNGGLAVFEYYFKDVDFHNPRHKFKIRSDEKTPSANVKMLSGQWRITDFGNQSDISGKNCIDWVKYHEGLQYIDALKFIMNVIIKKDISGGDYKKPVYQADYSCREVGPDDHKGKPKFIFKEEPLDSDLETIGRYVTVDHLQKLHGKIIESYEEVGYGKKQGKDIVHQWKSTPDYPIFLFDYGSFQKLYKPHEIEKKYRFRYFGEKPKDYIYGLDILEELSPGESEFVDEEKGDYVPPENKPKAVVKNLFRVSGETDALNMISLGYHIYFLNSESATFDKATYSKLDKYCDKHYQIMDLDKTGYECARINALKHMNLYTMQIPDWIKHKKDWRGNASKDMKDFINLAGHDEDGTRSEITKLIRRAKPMKFWEKTQEEVKGKMKVNYNINLEFYYFFMQMHGFYCMNSKYHKKAGYCYAKVEGKKVTLIHPDDIKRIAKTFTKEWIRSRNLIDEIAILNKINSSNQISENNLQELNYIDPSFDNYDESYETLVFNNGVLKVTKDKIERIKHTDLDNYILGELSVNNDKISHVIDHNIRLLEKSPITVDPSPEYAKLLNQRAATKNPDQMAAINAKINALEEWKRYDVKINDKDFFFAGFLRDLSRIHWRKEDEKKQDLTEQEKAEENQLLANLMFFIGYQCQQFKDPSKPWMGFLQDMKISAIGKSSGRSGKSLLSKVIGNVRSVFYVGARKKDAIEDQFVYDGYTKFHNNIEVDDLNEFQDIDTLYTEITGPRRVNNKHLSPETLQYEQSGKMFVSTNFELANTDNSTISRMLFVAVSDYYHESTKYNDYRETRSPSDKYNRRLFDHFTEEEWVKFYNLIAYCMQMAMRFPAKIQPPMENLEKRQLRRAMIKGVTKDEEFFVWANGYYRLMPEDTKLTTDCAPDDNGYFDMFILKEKAFENFKATLSDTHQRKYTAQQFKKSTKAWSEYYGYEFNPAAHCNLADIRKITKNVDGKTQECFFIATKPVVGLTPKEEQDMPF